MHADEDTLAPALEQVISAEDLVISPESYPTKLPILALPVRPLFPKVMVPIELESPELQRLVKDASKKDGLIGLVLERTDETSEFEVTTNSARSPHGDVYDVGVIAQITSLSAGEEGEMTAVMSALDRMRIVKVMKRKPYITAQVEYLEDKLPPDDELRAYTLAVINSVKDLVSLNPLYKEQLSLLLSEGSLEEPGPLSDLAAFLTSARGHALQEVLETLDVRRRLEKVLGLLKDELEISRLQTKIREKIEDRVNEQQREFFLREQLKAIKQELGIEKEEKQTELETFQSRLENKTLHAEAQKRFESELEKLRMLEPTTSEYAITRNYLDWLTDLPWGVGDDPKVTLKAASELLEKDHYGLADVKERIIEFIAEGILRGEFGGSIILLVGPPGVGKTSVGRSVASALKRQFYRFSLGGMRDEAEIKGHRKTYIGAMPGKFIQALRVCGTHNPVILLDEIDKMGASYQGDPASALLEVLDPEQNREFLDHYLDVRFDLSKVMFICTANQLDTIPPALLDRMEVIQLSGYILEEKLEIASRYLLPKALKNLKQSRSRVKITRPALRGLIDGYAREAGVRGLENHIKKVVRKCAVEIVRSRNRKHRVTVGPERIVELLGRPTFTNEALMSKPLLGVITGLAWTTMGGDTLFIEARSVKASATSFKQTGQLGKVMVESSEIAYTYIRSLMPEFFKERQIHLHVPAGAVPKDGPSAGVTMATALYSLAKGLRPRARVAMTGELNLSGRVLPVGGIKEKLIAAKRAKVQRVILPAANEPDYERLPEVIKNGISVHFVESFEQAIEIALHKR